MQRADCIHCTTPFYVSKNPAFWCTYSFWNQSPSDTEGQLYPYICMCKWCSCLPRLFSGKESACQGRRPRFDPWVSKIPWRRKRQPSPAFLPEKPHGQRSLAGYSSRGHRGLDTTECTGAQWYPVFLKFVFFLLLIR